MFTGLIPETGTITSVAPFSGGNRVVLKISSTHSIQLGDSIAVNGVCSTVVALTQHELTFDYLPETLAKTTFSRLSIGQTVNIEKSLRVGDSLGGHWVTGHVDTTGKLVSIQNDGPWHVIKIGYPNSFAPLIIPKGSVAIDGISLTLVDAGMDSFTCHIIPHTFENTHIKTLKVGDSTNLEFDIIGKYVLRSLQTQHSESKNWESALKRAGFLKE